MQLSFKQNVPLKEQTTLKIGGPAEQYLAITSEQTLDAAVGYAENNQLPITVLGGGSNVLISDDGVQGLLLHMQIKGIEKDDIDDTHVLLTASAGETFDDVVAYSVANGLWGLENLSYIPGTVGASPVQNIGAYGVEVKDTIYAVRVYNTREWRFEVLTAQECMFGYRDSLFKKAQGKKYIVVAVTFKLSTKANPQLQYKDLKEEFSAHTPSLKEVRDAIGKIRASKFPDWTKVGTAGSFFKNPIIPKQKLEELLKIYPDMPSFPVNNTEVKVPLAWILDNVLHMKGKGTKTVKLYEKQPLVLINTGAATSAEVIDFAEMIAQKVHDTTKITIQWEVTKI